MTVRSCAGLFALPIKNILEIMRPQPVQVIADMPSVMKGVAIIRGAPVPVMELSDLLNMKTDQKSSRFILLQAQSGRVALAVEDVVGLHRFQSSLFQILPPLFGTESREIISSIGLMDRQLLFVLETARLIPSDVWNALRASNKTRAS